MANISTYLRNKLLDKAVGAVDFTPAVNLYFRAFSTVLTAAGAGTELDGDGYEALEVENNPTNFPAAASGAKSNAVRFDFAPATADWDDILAIGVFDASSGGNLYYYQNLEDPLVILETENIYFDIGDIDFSIS